MKSKTGKDINELNIGQQMHLIEEGGSIDHDTGKRKTISIGLLMYQPLSKEASRWLLVNTSQLLLTNINRDKDLRQYLPDEGFTYKNVNVTIIFLTSDRTTLYHPDISAIALYEGMISYPSNDPKDIDGGNSPYKEVVYEPYEEALKIVELQGRPDEFKDLYSP